MINPLNIHCLALNYLGVGDENEIPLYFVKSLSTLCYSGSEVRYPFGSDKLWTEVELGIVIGHDCYNVHENDIERYIEGYTVCADITCSNLYVRDHHLAFSKSRENFCPTLNKISFISKDDLSSLKLTTKINGKLTQSGFVHEMKYNPLKSASFISKLTPLKKGDIILTGTPKGVQNNIIRVGDCIVQEIIGLGRLEYTIIE